MGLPVDFINILQYLNSSEDLSASFDELSHAFNKNQQELLQTLDSFNSLFNLIEINENKVFLREKFDLLDEQYIFKNIKGSGRVLVLESVDSTNTYMLSKAENLTNGDSLFAELQFAGRGRRGGKWVSGFAKQLTFSIAYTFSDINKVLGLSIGVGVAVAKAIESFGFTGIKLKWPNDIYIKDCKVGGILIETATTGSQLRAVIGVGLNVYADRLDVKDRLYSSITDRKTDNFDRNKLAVALINNIKEICLAFNENQKAPIFSDFSDRDYLKGVNISIQTEQGIVEGAALGIDESGSILLEQNGVVNAVRAGHIL